MHEPGRPASAVLANEEQYPWEVDPEDADRDAKVRWRTLVSADRTPSSGITMGVFELPPGAELAPHRHHPQEVYYVVAGEAEVFVDGGWRPARRGDVLYVPGDVAHGARNRGYTTCSVVWVFPTDTYDEIEYFDA